MLPWDRRHVACSNLFSLCFDDYPDIIIGAKGNASQNALSIFLQQKVQVLALYQPGSQMNSVAPLHLSTKPVANKF